MPLDCHQMDENRRLSRRRFAKVSFWFLIAFASIIVGAVLVHPSRLDISQSLNNVSGLLTGITTALVAIIMSYLGISAWERVRTGGQMPNGQGSPSPTNRERPAPPGASFPEN